VRYDDVSNGVIAGLDPAIHRIFVRRWMLRKKMDARVKPAHDDVKM